MSVEPAAQFNHDAKTKVVPSPSKPRRAGRGSLRGKLVLADDWDSPEMNEAIARDFGMPVWVRTPAREADRIVASAGDWPTRSAYGEKL